MNECLYYLVGKKLSKRKNTQYLHIFTDISCCLTLESFKYSFLASSLNEGCYSKSKMMILIIGDHPLTPWEKIAILVLGGAIVMVTMLIVACIVFPTCILFKWLNKGEISK